MIMSGPLKPLKRFGQHFLTDKNIIRKIIAAASLRRSDHVLEIGPGRGALTFELARRAKKVLAIEVDRGLCALLIARARTLKNVDIICRDALKCDLRKLARRSEIASFKIVSNLPYYITTPVIAHLFKNIRVIDDIYLMVQKEVGQRMTAQAGEGAYGSFSCFVNYFCRPEILFGIKAGSFYPAPKVGSCFIRLKPWPKKERPYRVKSEELLFKVIRSAFGQRRKRLASSLARVVEKKKLNSLLSRELLKKRAEELSLADFVSLSNQVFDILKKR